jgi:hypothetical protein
MLMPLGGGLVLFKQIAIGREYQWPVRLILFHQSRVLEFLHHSILALYPGISYTANLFTLENLPALAIIVIVKGNNITIIEKIDKSITSIALVAEINGKIKKINFSWSMSTTSKL